MIYFTSDLHFGSSNIIKYCDRPFKSADHMNKRLLAEINMRCKPEDTLYHVGDFVLYGKERGIENTRVKASEYEKMINCKVIHILGNHDRNNSVKNGIDGAYIRLSKDCLAWVQHHPPGYNDVVPPKANVYLCGHVHEKWKKIKYCNSVVVNVGCDVWNFRPVSKVELLQYIRQVL